MPDLTPPEKCADMAELRRQIDMLDGKLIDLLAARAGYIDRAVELKTALGWPANIPSRVEDVVNKTRTGAARRGLDPDLAEALWRELIEWSITREARHIDRD